MSGTPAPTPDSARHWLGYVLVWLLLLTMMAATLALAYLPLGPIKLALHLAIAAFQVALIWTFFMSLRASSALVRLAAVSGLFWLTFMFTLTFTDYLSRL